jgi:hypothetical protein
MNQVAESIPTAKPNCTCYSSEKARAMMGDRTQLMIPNGNKNLLLKNTDLFSDYCGINFTYCGSRGGNTCSLCLRSWLFSPFTFSFKAFGSSGNGVPVSGRLNESTLVACLGLSSTAVVLASVAPSCSLLDFPRFLPAMASVRRAHS